MRIVEAGSVSYRIVAVERDGQWAAHAEREDTGRPFGIDCTGATEEEAVDRLGRWLAWQSEHAAALVELQAAERRYHRTVAGAVGGQMDAPAIAAKTETLSALDAARSHLDHIRSRKPEHSA